VTAQENAAFTVTQAQQLASNYSAVLQYDDTSSSGNNTRLSLKGALAIDGCGRPGCGR